MLSALLAGGWTGVVLLTAIMLLSVGAMCWVLDDPERLARASTAKPVSYSSGSRHAFPARVRRPTGRMG